MTQPVPMEQPPEEMPDELSPAEIAFAAAVTAALAAWLSVTAAAVLAPFYRFGGSPDPRGVDRTAPQWNAMVDRLISDLEVMSRRGWEAATSMLSIQLPFDRRDDILREQLLRTRNLLVNIPNEVYRDILAQMAISVQNGETTAQQAARVANVLDFHGSQNWPHRGTIVARTEVPRAYEYGGLAAAQRAQQNMRRAVRKTWDARRDSATRIAHKLANGQERSLTDRFVVGGERLWSPLDPTGRPDNVINCRCRTQYRWEA